jgi:hypothetical protein
VESVALLGDPELVHIKGAQEPVPARVLLGMAAAVEPIETNRRSSDGSGRWALSEVFCSGRSTAMAASSGSVGPPGIGKSRVVRELTAQAKGAGRRGIRDILRIAHRRICRFTEPPVCCDRYPVGGLDDAAARQQVRERFPGAPADDLLLMDDLLGIGDPAAAMPQIDADARRRRDWPRVVKADCAGSERCRWCTSSRTRIG